MIPAAAFVLCLGLVAAVPHRVARQADCPDAFMNVPNPCKSNPDQSIYFPHPTDNSKFIQCDLFGRMFIVQCPAGETYVSASTSCVDLSKPLPVVASTAAPVVVVTATSGSATVGSNPCTKTNIEAGNIYFSVANDITKFIECDLLGHPTILDCPTGLVWQESRLSCVFQLGTVLPGSGSTGTGSGSTGTGSGSTGTGTDGGNTMTNPCTVESLSAGQLFFSYASDSNKFLQCDLWGDVYVNTCPSGLKWNDSAKTCASGFINFVPSGN